MTTSAKQQRSRILNVLKQVVTGIHFTNASETMNESLRNRYFNIIQKQIKDEQTYLAIIQRQPTIRRGSKLIVRQTLQ